MKDFLFLFFVMVVVSVLTYFVLDREINDLLLNILVLTIALGVGSFTKYLLEKQTKEN